MRRALLFPLFVLIAAPVSVNAVENKDLKALDLARQINEALWTLFPVNVAKGTSNAGSDSNRTIGGKCSEQLTLFQEGLTNGSTWALKMIDASSKIPPGILKGNRIDLGMFDECVQINVNESGQELRGRHCMYTILAGLEGISVSETLSICVPSSCEPEDVQIIVRNGLKQIGEQVGMDIPISVGGTTCTAVDSAEWTAGGIVTLVGFSILLLFLIVCTTCDIFARYSNDKPPSNGRLHMLRQFSLYSNAVRVLSTKTSPETMPVLQGLRFFSMCWVIYGHAHIIAFLGPIVNPIDPIEWVYTWNYVHLVLAPFAVDSFFAISGFLMSYIFLKEMSTRRSFNLFGYYLHRYLRLTPALVAMILIIIFIVPRLGSGALWENNSSFSEQSCRDTWWTMLLYVQNYANEVQRKNCMGHTWYLAVEMQFFWISPLILYPLAKKPKIGLGILAALFVAAVATPVKIGYDNEYTSIIVSTSKFSEIGSLMDNFYFASHVRCAPWLIGIFFGYLTITRKGTTTSKATKWIGWLMTIAAFAFCVFGTRVSEDESYEYDIVWESFYTGLARPLWGFAISWIIYACVSGFGGPLSTFLSYPIYTPLSRISYCVYLVHYEIQSMKGRAARTSNYFSAFTIFNSFLSDLLLSIVVGFAFCLLFETPFLLLEKIVRKRCERPKNASTKVLRDEEVEKGIDNSCRTPS